MSTRLIVFLISFIIADAAIGVFLVKYCLREKVIDNSETKGQDITSVIDVFDSLSKNIDKLEKSTQYADVAFGILDVMGASAKKSCKISKE